MLWEARSAQVAARSMLSLSSADRAVMSGTPAADRQWEASRASLDRTHSRIASLTKGLDLPARAAAPPPPPAPRRAFTPSAAPAVTALQPQREPESQRQQSPSRSPSNGGLPRGLAAVRPEVRSGADPTVALSGGDAGTGGDAARWRRESERNLAEAERLRRELAFCEAARDAAVRRADEAAAAAETAARACDALKELAAEGAGGGPPPASAHRVLDATRAASELAEQHRAGAPALSSIEGEIVSYAGLRARLEGTVADASAGVRWARGTENLRARVALSCLRTAWRVWAAAARRSYLYRLRNGSLFGASTRRSAVAPPPPATPIGTLTSVPVSVLRSDGELERRHRSTVLATGNGDPSSSPRWEAQRPEGDDWRPYGAKSAEALSPAQEEKLMQLRATTEQGWWRNSVPEVGRVEEPAAAARPAATTLFAAPGAWNSPETAAGGWAAGRRRSPPSLTVTMGSPGPSAWAMLHPTAGLRDATLAHTWAGAALLPPFFARAHVFRRLLDSFLSNGAEHGAMARAVDTRAEQHLVAVRRKLRTSSG